MSSQFSGFLDIYSRCRYPPLPSFVTSEAAFQSGLTYITDNGTVIMKADDFTDLAQGAFRNRYIL